MKADVRRKINAASTAFFTDSDIEDALNEAYEEMADATEFYERQATIDMLAGRTYYDLTSLLPDTFLSPRRAWNTTTQKWFGPTDTLERDSAYVQWELTYGAPEYYLLRGNWWLGVWPRANDDTSYKARVYYTAIPEHMSAATDTPAFPKEFHQGVVDLALAELFAQNRDPKKVISSWKSGESYVAGLRDHVNARQRLAKTNIL